MNKFQKLAELFKDIEILEANEKFVAASILHDKFIRVAQESDQVMDEDFLQKEIKRLADEFEDYIQNAILGRNVNNSLDTAKHNIDQVEKYLGPKYSQNIKDYAQAQLDIMRKRFADMYQKYYVKDNVDQSSKPFRGKLSGAEEKSVYVKIIKQIEALLKRKNIPAAMKLSSDYRNWFSDETLNKNFQANVDNLLDTYVDNENTSLPPANMSSVNENVNSQNPEIAPLSRMKANEVEPIANQLSMPQSNGQAQTTQPSSTNKPSNYFTMANIEKILKSNSTNRFDEASMILDTLLKEVPKPSAPAYMSDKETPEYQRAYKKWEEATGTLTDQYISLIQKYKKNLRRVDKKYDPTAKSTPEQAKVSALWQQKWYAIYNSKLPRFEKYKKLMYIHAVAERLLDKGKISAKGFKTFSDLQQKTLSLNVPYPIPGDPGFVPEII